MLAKSKLNDNGQGCVEKSINLAYLTQTDINVNGYISRGIKLTDFPTTFSHSKRLKTGIWSRVLQ